jgi:molybdate transport system permease protein
MPNCKQGILAGAVLSFARALGEFGATTMVSGYIPGRTAIISTTVYQLWREGNDALAYKWVFINLIISFIVLVTVNMLENSYKEPVGAAKDHFEHED